MLKKIFVLILFSCVVYGQSYSPQKKDMRYSWAYSHQMAGDTLATMVFVVSNLSTTEISIDSAATASDTTDLGGIKKIIGIFASSTFDSSAVTIDINLSGTALFSVFTESAQFSVNLDASGLIYFDSPIYARNVKVNFAAQTSDATITLIYE